MRDPKRIYRISNKLALLWSRPPWEDQRLGQMLTNIARIRATRIADPLWNLEDDQWEQYIDELLEEKERAE